MSNKDILSNAIFNLPKHRKGEDFATSVEKMLSELNKTLGKFDGDLKTLIFANKELIDKQCISIVKAIQEYLKGYPHKAYIELKSCLDDLKASGLLPIQEFKVSTGLDEYYRVRVGQKSFDKKGLFHIPFHIREKVSTQRYSIPGLPCLYLGDSIYVCWEELNQPDINQLNVSRFDLNNSGFKFLLFNETADDYKKRCFQNNPNGQPMLLAGLTSFLTYFPLLASCSFQVDKPKDVFKPEYIIPQLLLQWIVGEQDLDGVKYRSNRIKYSDNMAGTFSNIAIPAKIINDDGFCPELQNKILFTEPISWHLIDIANDRKKLKLSIDEITRSTRRVRKIELIQGESVDYFLTKFGKFEERLRTLPVKTVT